MENAPTLLLAIARAGTEPSELRSSTAEPSFKKTTIKVVFLYGDPKGFYFEPNTSRD